MARLSRGREDKTLSILSPPHDGCRRSRALAGHLNSGEALSDRNAQAATARRETVPLLTRRKNPTVPNYYPDWFILREIAAHVSASLSSVAHGRLLDLGCGCKPYEVFRPSAVTEWVGFDVPSNTAADVHGHADALPFDANCFDAVLCTEVLEHLPEPALAIAEMDRVLRPGGHVILTTPLYFPIHEEPYDFFRYTPYGLRHLFENAGFEIVSTRALATGARLIATAINTTLNDFGKQLPSAERGRLGRYSRQPMPLRT